MPLDEWLIYLRSLKLFSPLAAVMTSRLRNPVLCMIDIVLIKQSHYLLQSTFNGIKIIIQICRATEAIKSSGAEVKLAKILKPFLESTFGDKRPSNRYAVRSSGVLEDGADLSCAGQNETYLGVDEESIPKKIVECWASLFTPQSVSYRL
jgi:hypothetical protein